MTTGWAARSLVEDYGIAEDEVHAVGVGRNHDVPFAERDWTTPTFLFVGTNWIAKNGDAVLRAFARLQRELPNARLDMVDDHPRVELEGVTGHGWLRLDSERDRGEMEHLFQRATCFVMPSRYEASAIAYVEVGGAGLPCIGTTVGGSGELIGPAGRLIDPGDDDALLAAMLELSDRAAPARVLASRHRCRLACEVPVTRKGEEGAEPAASVRPFRLAGPRIGACNSYVSHHGPRWQRLTNHPAGGSPGASPPASPASGARPLTAPRRSRSVVSQRGQGLIVLLLGPTYAAPTFIGALKRLRARQPVVDLRGGFDAR